MTLGPGKVENIYARTGRLPVFAVGNGDVDIEMLESAKFRLFIKHDEENVNMPIKMGQKRY